MNANMFLLFLSFLLFIFHADSALTMEEAMAQLRDIQAGGV